MIRPRYDGDMPSGRVAKFRAIAEQFDIHVRHGRGIFGGIRDIDFSFQGER